MKSNLLQNILFGMLILAGIGFRAFRLGEVPVSLYWDEAAIGVDALAVSRNGKDMHGNPALQAIYPSYGDYKLPLYILLDSIVVKLVGLSPASVRIPSFLAGLGLIYMSYLLAKELFKKQTIALFAATIMSVLPVEILFSRTGFEGHLASVFIAVSLYLWLRSFKRVYLLFFSSLTSAMAVYSYFSARIVIPLMAIITFLVFFKKTSRKWKFTFFISFCLWLLLLLPINNSPFYEQSNQFRLSTKNLLDVGQFALESNVLREQSGNSFLSRLIYHRYLLQTVAIAKNVTTHFNPEYLFISGDENLRHSTGMVGVMYLGMSPLLIAGWSGMYKKNPSVALWLTGLWLASIVPAAIPTEVPHALRSLNSDVAMVIFAAYGMYYFFKRIPKIGILITILIVSEMAMFCHDYFHHYPVRSAQDWQDGYFQLADYLDKHRDQFRVATINYGDDRLFLYFLFVNQTNTETIPKNPDSFVFKSFDKYKFQEDVPSLNDPLNWVVVDGYKWRNWGEPSAKLLPSNNDVQFAVINGI